jgi:hypothetical protein
MHALAYSNPKQYYRFPQLLRLFQVSRMRGKSNLHISLVELSVKVVHKDGTN